MRRKTKQLLATGMALAVLATNLTPLSLAAETAAEMQTGEVATQALSDEIEVQAARKGSKNHDLGNVHVDGSLHFSSDGTSYYADWKADCGNDICKTENVNFRGTTKSFGYDREADNCTEGKVYYFNARSVSVDYEWTGLFYNYKHNGTLNIGEQKYVVRKPGHDLTVTWNGDQAMITCSRGDVSTTLTGDEKLKEVVTEATCEKEGLATYCYAVVYDGVTYESDTTFDKVIPKTEHSYDVAWSFDPDNKKATATFTCEKCGDVQTREAAMTETVQEPDCEHAGSITYTAESVVFNGVKIPGGTQTIETKKLGHDYGTPEWNWSDDKSTATLTMECKREGCGKTVEEDAKVESEITTEPTCENEGVKTFTATVTVDDNDYTATETSAVPATGHNYEVNGADAWNWTADENGATATVSLKCTECDHVESPVKATVTEKRTPATCTAEGSVVYTATADINGQTFTDTCTVKLLKLDHDYTKLDNDHVKFTFSEDGKSATATIQCSRCDETKPADANAVKVDSAVTTKPGCTTVGTTTYTATLGNASATTTRNDVEPTGHFYLSDPDHQTEWNEEDKTATLYYACMNCGDKQHETVQGVKDDKNSELPTCTEDGYDTYVATGAFTGVTEKDQVATGWVSNPFKVNKLGHDCELTLEWDDDTYTSATATVKCSDCDYEYTVPVEITAERTEPTCTGNGYIDYTATAEVTYDPETEGRSPEKESAQIYGRTILSATGHHYGAYHCTNNGTEVAACDHCGATTARAATGSAVCDAHTVDGASVCAVCGKVNGSALLPQITAASNANTKAITSGAQLVVRAGTLPSGQKILTVAYLDANGEVLNLTGSWKVRVPLAELQAQLGATEGNGFEHTLTLLAPNGEKKAVGFAVENGTVIFDATFSNSTACILLVD